MYCASCGIERAADENFCSSCGAAVEKDRQVSGVSEAGKGGTVFIVLGWVMFAISILFIPIIFGAGAFIMGYLLRKYARTHGTILMVMAVAGAVLGMLLGAAVAGY